MSVENPAEHQIELVLSPTDNQRLANLCGPLDQHLRQVEKCVCVKINTRGNSFQVKGNITSITLAEQLIRDLYDSTRESILSPETVHLFLQEATSGIMAKKKSGNDAVIKIKRQNIRGRSPNQQLYIKNIQNNDINFGIGPAGTGKTYLAVASAVAALEQERIRRLILVRPAVEAGERLGFLPGDLVQKVDPYLRPLYDALYELLGLEKVTKYIERNVIEIAPLAFMRGRTLNESFVILDEAQNTTNEQMKMFLTRIGFGSTAIITGDITQIDLPVSKNSGLKHVIDILNMQEGISFTWFQSTDVVRHPLVAKILNAYERYEKYRSGKN